MLKQKQSRKVNGTNWFFEQSIKRWVWEHTTVTPALWRVRIKSSKPSCATQFQFWLDYKARVCLKKKKKKGRKEGKNEGGRVGEKSREERLGEWLKR
jgi:hypothetical protein